MTGDKRTGKKNTENKFKFFLDNSESYCHQINHLVERFLVTKEQVQKNGLAVAGIMDELRTNMMDKKITFFGGF